MDQQQVRMAGNLTLEQARIQLLLEAGRVEEANSAAEQFAEPARQAGLRDWTNTVALTCLPDANYARAAELWRESVEQTEKLGISNLLLSLPPRPSNTPWPLGTTQVAFDFFFSIPEAIAERKLDLAMLYLEEGFANTAEETFREALAANPETPGRILTVYYINELTGTNETDYLPPSERIPMQFAPEPEDEVQPASP
jgi:tetratricopeptide (TPR) repeat protein